MRQRSPFADDRAARIADARLRERVNDAIATFKCCLDATANRPNEAAIDNLRDATNRLMRASARVLIELERNPVSMH